MFWSHLDHYHMFKGRVFVASFRLWVIRISLYSVKAVVAGQSSSHEAVRVNFQLKQGLRVFPGCYFHIFLPGRLFQYDLIQSYPVSVLWHEPGQLVSADGIANASFLMSRQGRLHGALRLSKGENILLDGPYGQYLELGKYETVILTAKGIGIAGILSSALILLERRRHDSAIKSQRAGISDPRLFRDATRKVALFWVLESVSQEDWIAPELTRLQRLDKDNVSRTSSRRIIVFDIFRHSFLSGAYTNHRSKTISRFKSSLCTGSASTKSMKRNTCSH